MRSYMNLTDVDLKGKTLQAYLWTNCQTLANWYSIPMIHAVLLPPPYFLGTGYSTRALLMLGKLLNYNHSKGKSPGNIIPLTSVIVKKLLCKY